MRLEVDLKYYKVSWWEPGVDTTRGGQILVGQSARHVREVVREAYPHVTAIRIKEVVA